MEIAKLQLACLSMFSDHRQLFRNEEGACAHVVARLQKLSKTSDWKQRTEKQWFGDLNSWYLATAHKLLVSSFIAKDIAC